MCVPVWKFDLLQCRWKPFPILPCCTTGVDVISQKTLKKTLIGEEVVEEDMMVLPLQLSSQCLHNSRSKVVVLSCVTLLPSIYFKAREVAIVTICKDPYLYVRFVGLRGIYCFSEDLLWNFIIASSTATSRLPSWRL